MPRTVLISIYGRPTRRNSRPRSNGSSRSAPAGVEDWVYPDDADFIVLADTEGNLFCVIDAGR